MSEREAMANRQLRVLDRAYRHGQIDRAAYRAGRRDLLCSLRVREEVTARNAIVRDRNRAVEGAGRDQASSILFDTRTPSWLSTRRMLVLLAGLAALVLAVIWLAGGDAHGG